MDDIGETMKIALDLDHIIGVITGLLVPVQLQAFCTMMMPVCGYRWAQRPIHIQPAINHG